MSKKKKSKAKKEYKSSVLALLTVTLPMIAAALIVGAGCYVWLNSHDVGAKGELNNIRVDIAEGSSVSEIIHSLKENGVIDSEFHFKYLCKATGNGSQFKSGSYELTNQMSFDEIVAKLNTGAMSADSVRFTVKEGAWLSEIASQAEELGLCTRDEFITAANSRDYDYDFVAEIPQRDNLLEGYLFPDTYFVEKNASAHDIVDMMLGEFDQSFDSELKAQAQSLGRSVDDIVIIASLIESEVKYPDERATVASVIYNRLNKNMKLQLDASVLYALGEKKSRVYYSDLEVNEPHNTYVVDGLPVGPISNPGKACLVAAANPESTDYLYYVLQDDTTGQHKFSSNYETFQADKNKYLASK
jgi:UPF0755 protein